MYHLKPKNHIDGSKSALLIFFFQSAYAILAALQIRVDQGSITANLWPLTSYIYHVIIIVTGGFSKKIFFIIFRSSRTQIFFKTGVVRNFAIFTEKHLCWNLFLIKLQVLWPATLFQPRPKNDFNTGDWLTVVPS